VTWRAARLLVTEVAGTIPESMAPHSPVPFIVGVGRSGTTLLRFMLDAHSELCIPPETGFLPGAAALLADEANARERFFALVTGFKTWGDFSVDSERFHDALSALEPFGVSAGVRAFYRTYAERHGKPRFGDKSPNYSTKLPVILAVLPEARFIHIIRDGRDVALSNRDVWFGKDKSVEQLVDIWRRRIAITRQLAAECPHYMELRYEDLVRDSETELRRVDAAVARTGAARDRAIASLDFSLIGRPDTYAEALRARAVWLHLDEEIFTRKMATARAYPELAGEVEEAVASLGLDAFRTECLRPVDASTFAAPVERPFYEVHGEHRVATGHYQHTLRYADHVRPVAVALQQWLAAGTTT